MFGRFATDLDAEDDLLTFAIRRLGETLRDPTSGLFITLLAESVRPAPHPGADDPAPAVTGVGLHESLRERFAAVGARLPLRDGVTADDFALVVMSYATGVHQAWRGRPDQVDLDRALGLLQTMIERSLLDPGHLDCTQH